MEKIQMVDLKGQYNKIKDEVQHEMNAVLDNMALINGPVVREFASDLEAYLGVNHVIPCANGTDAIQIAFMALDLEQGDEVLVPSWTYVATVEVIALMGLKPVFVEVDANSFNMDIQDLKDKITPKCKAIVPVHLYGQCANMEEILMIGRENDLYIIEDTAQAIGADYFFSNGNTTKAGTMGTIGTTSFFPSKNLGCFGDGGAIFTNDEDLAKKMRMIANHGQSKKYVNSVVGINSRLDSLQAAVLKVKLRHLDEYAAKRNEVARVYNEAFASIEEIATPLQSEFTSHVYHQYTLKLDPSINRDILKLKLAEKGVPSMIYYPIPNHMQEAYMNYGYRLGDLTVTEQLSKTVISLPIHTEMSPATQVKIISAVQEALNIQLANA